MSKLNSQNYSWITQEQELLLKASLMQGNDAVQSWEEWQSKVDFDLIDPGSYRLLPLLYNNLTKHEIKHPLMNRLKGIYRRTWYENQIYSHQTLKLLKLFQIAGIKTIVLKGIALIHLYYKDYGLRPMSDIDILVPTLQASSAFRILQESGWNSAYKSPVKIIPVIHSCDFTDSAVVTHLDLHWHLFIECCQLNADEDFWDGSMETIIKDTNTRVLNPADQFLHTCIHGMKWSIIPPFRWIADAVTILNKSQTEINWDRMLAQAKKRKLVLPLRNGLEYLVTNLNVSVPPGILKELKSIPISKTENIEFNYKIKNQKKKLLGNIPVLWFDSLRLSEDKSLRNKLISFIKYMQRFWDLESLWQLPSYTLNLTLNKLRLMIHIMTGKKESIAGIKENFKT